MNDDLPFSTAGSHPEEGHSDPVLSFVPTGTPLKPAETEVVTVDVELSSTVVRSSSMQEQPGVVSDPPNPSMNVGLSPDLNLDVPFVEKKMEGVNKDVEGSAGGESSIPGGGNGDHEFQGDDGDGGGNDGDEDGREKKNENVSGDNGDGHGGVGRGCWYWFQTTNGGWWFV